MTVLTTSVDQFGVNLKLD